MTRLKAARLNKGLSVAAVAESMGVKESTYRYWERTGGMPRDAATVRDLMQVLDIEDVISIWPLEESAA
jgi:transcriptional regulator with XRE-family HTH domain